MFENMKFEIRFNRSKTVEKIYVFENDEAFSVCPSCNLTLERDYQSYCDRCGQKLNWKHLNEAKIIRYNREKATNI